MGTDLCTTDEILSLRAQILVARTADATTVQRVAALLERFPDSPELWELHGQAIRLAEPGSGEAAKSFERAQSLRRL